MQVINTGGVLIIGTLAQRPTTAPKGTTFVDRTNGNSYLWIDNTWLLVGSNVSNLSDLSDVVITSPIDGEVLTYDDGTGNWVNVAIPTDHLIEDAVTNDTTDVAITHNTTGTPANGLGTGVTTAAETSTTPSTLMGAIEWVWATITHASRRATAKIYGYYAANKTELAVFETPSTTSISGNPRGAGAVDLQGFRNAPTHVAAGLYSVIGGGGQNLINPTNSNYSVIGGGNGNEISANGQEGVIGGGSNNVVSAVGGTVVGGAGNEAGEEYSTVLGGIEGVTRTLGQVVSAANSFVNPGDAQATVNVVFSQSITHSSTGYETIGIAQNLTNRYTLNTSQVITFDILLVGTTSGTGKSFGFRIEGLVKNNASAITVLASTVTTIYNADDTSFDARVLADSTNDALLVQVRDTDGAGDTVRWVATLRAAEVTY